MLCSNCKTEISSAFRYSFAKNECPACGKPIMDEESLALMEDMQKLLLAEGNIRQETAQKLAMSLMANYSISFRDDISIQKSIEIKSSPAQTVISHRVPKDNPNIVRAEEVPSNGISEAEREKIFEEVVRKKFAIVDSIQAITENTDHGLDSPNIDIDPDMVNPAMFVSGAGSELESTILENDRLNRLTNQQRAMESGFTVGGKKAAFTRSS
jgi:Zn-finger nucleic acid-binding protein